MMPTQPDPRRAGVAYIELAIILLVMVIVFFGMVEVTAYVRMKNKINQAADHLAEALSTMPGWDPSHERVGLTLPAAEIMMRPFGGMVSLSFCSGTAGEVYRTDTTYGRGNCSLLENPPSEGVLQRASCEDAKLGRSMGGGAGAMTEVNPTVQYVVVAVSCRYSPYIESMKIFGNAGMFGNIAVTARTVKPMRYHMQWDMVL